MELDDAKFPNNTKVELLPGREDVYPRGIAAMRGIVISSKRDKFGYEMVKIIWDREHWRYSGEDDVWTFAEHFRKIEDRELVGAEEFDVPMTPPQETTEERQEAIKDYLDSIMVASDKASESDGFVTIFLKRNENGHLNVEIFGSSADEEIEHMPSSDLFLFMAEEMRGRGQ